MIKPAMYILHQLNVEHIFNRNPNIITCTCLEDSTPTTSTIDQPLVEVKRDIGISTATMLQRFVAQAQAETQRDFP